MNIDQEEIEKMVKENLELTRQIKEEVDGIKRHIFWTKVWGFTKVILIVLPLIIAYIYLIPVFGNVLKQYAELLGIQNGVTSHSAGEKVPSDIINSVLKNK